MYEYVGCIHIHSTDSDGSKPVPEIIKIGQEAGLDFLMLSDHMTLKSLKAGQEGWFGKTLVIIGYEINDLKNKNHYLAFNLEEVLPEEMSVAEYVQEVKKRGGLGIIAHPDEVRNQLPQYPPYPWTAWEVSGFDGIEIWNQMSEWMEKLTKFNQLKMVLHPRKSLKGPTTKILNIWDQEAQRRKVVGIGGVDAHAHPYTIGPFRLTIFPYLVQFKSIRTHVLLKEPFSKNFLTAKRQLFSAIKNCNIFISNYAWGDAKGFEFSIESGDERGTVGDEITIRNKAEIKVETPATAQLKLIHNGNLVKEVLGAKLEYVTAEPGVYRVEAYRNDRGWIFSNHIRLKK